MRLYAILVEGKTQSFFAQATGMNKSQVSRLTKQLVDKGYLIRPKKRTRCIIYRKGPKGPILDQLILARSLSQDATGVTPSIVIVSPNYATVPTARVHHLNYRMKVIKVGKDLKLKAHNKGEKGVWRYSGKLPYYGDFVTVMHEVSAKQNWLYIHPPAMDLPRNELDRYDDRARGIVLDIRKTLMRQYEWVLGEVEDTNWSPHFGIDSSSPMGQYVSKYRMTSDDGIATTSSSDGREEMEFQGRDGLEYTKTWLELPGTVMRHERDLKELRESMKQIVGTLHEEFDAWTLLVKMQGLMIAKEANNMDRPERIRSEPFSGENQVENGGMYQ